MAAPLSVIIPTLNAMSAIGPCLAALGEGLEAGLIAELVISDGGSGDDIATLADEAGARFVSGPAGRGGQLNAGAQAARGDWLLFLHADTVLQPGWAAAVAAHLAHEPGTAGYFKLRFDSTALAARIIAGGANLRSRLFGLPYGDQGLLISRDLYDAVGGFPDQPLMEDVAMAKRFRGRLRGLDGVASTSAARYHRDGWFRRALRNLILLMRYKLGADPARLAAAYRGSSAN